MKSAQEQSILKVLKFLQQQFLHIRTQQGGKTLVIESVINNCWWLQRLCKIVVLFIIAKNSAEKFVFMMYDIIFADY